MTDTAHPFPVSSYPANPLFPDMDLLHLNAVLTVSPRLDLLRYLFPLGPGPGKLMYSVV